MVYSSYKKQRILHFHTQGFKAPTIAKLLAEENLCCLRVGVAKFLKHYKEMGSIGRQADSERVSQKIYLTLRRAPDEHRDSGSQRRPTMRVGARLGCHIADPSGLKDYDSRAIHSNFA